MFDQNPSQPQPPSNLPFGQPQNPFMPPPPSANQAQPSPAAFPSAAPQQAPSFAPPTNLPVAAPPVEDMFSSDQSAASANMPSQGMPAYPRYQPGPQITEADLFRGSGLPWGKIITIAIIVLVIMGGIGAVAWGVSYFAGRMPATPALPQTPPATVIPETPAAVPPPATTTPLAPAEVDKDSDADGLVDSEEKSFGTDVNRADTDADGLTDWAEVKIYRTQPLIPDTDGDSYADGAEVVNGYDPLIPGSARLYEVPKASSTK